MDPITLRVLTDGGLAIEDQAVSIVAPGEIGYLGVLRNHAPLVTTIQPGELTWRRSDGSRRTVLVGSGLFEVSQNRCTLLTSRLEEAAQQEPPV